jgi:FixJ family two-component response regulator
MPEQMPRIVVVEDDLSMSQAIERLLRAGGFAVVLFPSAEAALEAGVAAASDCLILDVHLPGMSGFDLYRRLASAGERVPAIFMTAHDEPAIREEAERLGASSYLSKPFSGRTLLDSIARGIRPFRPEATGASMPLTAPIEADRGKYQFISKEIGGVARKF